MCGAEIELDVAVQSPAFQLESWRTGHRHDAKDEHVLPDADAVKGSLPQVPIGGVYASTSLAGQRRVVTAHSKPIARTVSLDWKTP